MLLKKLLIKVYEYGYAYVVRKKREREYRQYVKKYSLKVMSTKKTIKYIQKHGCSVARFGDGEFDMISGIRNLKFQKSSEALGKELLKVLNNKNPKLLICLPLSFTSIKGSNWHAAMYWKRWAIEENNFEPIIKTLSETAGLNYVYGNAQITRPYIDWESSKNAKRTFPLLKQLWNDKKLLIVEGQKTRLGIGNDLFSNAKRIRRILCPATNAFEKYDEILSFIIDVHEEDEVIVLALGPTATVLASELCNKGLIAYDLGHIDIEYEWFLSKAKTKTAIKGKYVNEVVAGENAEECVDKQYLSEIIGIVGD